MGRDPLGLYEIPEAEIEAWKAANPDYTMGELFAWIDYMHELHREQEEPSWWEKAGRKIGDVWSWVGQKKRDIASWAGEKARGAVEDAIPAADADADREEVARLTGQEGTVAGEGGAHLRNEIREEGGEVAEHLAEEGTGIALEVGQDYLLGAGIGRTTKLGRGARTARAIDRAKDYERRIRSVYGEAGFRARQFQVVKDGKLVD
jgi:hypothetical protein